jgi:hypothetical protein
MTTEYVTDEEVEEVGVWADRLVLYRVFEKRLESDGKTRYFLTSRFKHHLKQFAAWFKLFYNLMDLAKVN